MTPILILAGGLGSRMYPLTLDKPKCLLPVNGLEFLFHQLTRIFDLGSQNVVLCLGHLSDQVIARLRDSSFDRHIHVSLDGNKNLGTGGAILRYLDHLEEVPKDFIVLYGDVYPDDCFRKILEVELSTKAVAMSAYKNENKLEPSNILVKDASTAFYNKFYPLAGSKHIDAGYSKIRTSEFVKYSTGIESFDFGDFLHSCSDQNLIFPVETNSQPLEIGSMRGYEKCCQILGETK